LTAASLDQKVAVNPVIKYSFNITDRKVVIKDVEMGSEWDLRICGTELCYPIGVNLLISGPTVRLHLVCELGRPCYGINNGMKNHLKGRGMDLVNDKIGLIRTLDWTRCGDGVEPLYTLNFGQLFTDPLQ
jgi:hypothetical protein